ncbi:MAG: hypothetical protein IJ466_02670 [Clostridia bacterium]|nr:hypothetical protein [Clostridia bacterium]
MPVSKAHQKATAKYLKNNCDEVKFRVPKGRRAEMEARAKAEEASVNAITNRLWREYLGMSEEEWKKVEKPAAEE